MFIDNLLLLIFALLAFTAGLALSAAIIWIYQQCRNTGLWRRYRGG